MRLGRRRTLVLVAPVVVLLVSACNPSVSPPAYRPPTDRSLVSAAGLDPCPVAGKPAKGGLPHLTLHCLDGSSTVDLAGVKGPALVNLWYSTCGPCREEAPLLRTFYGKAKGKLVMLGVDVEPTPDGGLTFDANYGLKFPSVSDQHTDVPPKLKVPGYPVTYFLDATGKLTGTPHPGPFTSEAELAAAVQKNLGITVS